METRTIYQVKVTKAKTGAVIEGFIRDDGLQSLWPVYADQEFTEFSGQYASVLDSISQTLIGTTTQ